MKKKHRALQQHLGLTPEESKLLAEIITATIENGRGLEFNNSESKRRKGRAIIDDDESADNLRLRELIEVKSLQGKTFLRATAHVTAYWKTEHTPLILDEPNAPPLNRLVQALEVYYEDYDFFQGFRDSTQKELTEAILHQAGTPLANHFKAWIGEPHGFIGLMVCAQFARAGKPLYFEPILKCVEPDVMKRRAIIEEINSPSWSLYQLGLVPVRTIRNGPVAGLSVTVDVVLEFECFAPKFQVLSEVQRGIKGQTDAAEINKQELLYPEGVKQALDRMKQNLDPHNFQKAQRKLENHNLSIGYTAMLLGGPGTGKTSFVRQLARSTGRDLIEVDIAGLRGAYFGESEKFTRGLFRYLEERCRTSARTPIVFIDEADGMLHRRDGLNHELEVKIITILLQEIEAYDGILIFASNHLQGMDEAFRRRISHVIAIPQPDERTKVALITHRFPQVSEEFARQLARTYNFNGSNVDVVLRSSMYEDLDDATPAQWEAFVRDGIVQSLLDWQQLERQTRKPSGIGF